MARSIEDAASKGVAGAGLGLGIAGTALALLNSRGLFGLGGGVGVDTAATVGAAALLDDQLEHMPGLACPTAWQVEQKECQDVMEMERQRCNDIRYFDGKLFDLELGYERQRFSDYKDMRDKFDIANERISNLECRVTANEVADKYERKITQLEILDARKDAKIDLFVRTCRMITGDVVLPNEPTVTGLQGSLPNPIPYGCGCNGLNF